MDEFDVAIVGARCAGAALGTHLARAGKKVVVLEAADLPSDQPFSTHAIQPKGMQYLSELGVAEAIRRVTPPVRLARFAVTGAHLDVALPQGFRMYCPRRSVLDPLLQEALVKAGADLRPKTAVIGLLHSDDRVCGVKVKTHTGTQQLKARLVVGADGRNSTIARLVRAPMYKEFVASRSAYWAYWDKPSKFDTDSRFPFQSLIDIRDKRAAFCFESDSNLLIMGLLGRPEALRKWSDDPKRYLVDGLTRHPVLGPLVEGRDPTTKPIGLRKLTFFFRKAVGPGWALVGDAGLHKDPTPGLGITDALRDAQALAGAILEGDEYALERYWRQRDVRSIPLYRNAEDMGALDYDNPMTRLVFRHVNASPELGERMRLVLLREISPQALVPPQRLLRWIGGAIVRGQLDIIKPFLAAGRRGAALERELSEARTALARVGSETTAAN